jgi:hypothetical protein
MKNIMKNKTGRLLFLLFLILPLAAQANIVSEGKDGNTWIFSSVARMTTDGIRYDIYYENDYDQGMITRDAEIDVEPFGQLDDNGLPLVLWSRQKGDGYYHLFMSSFNGAQWSEPEELPVLTDQVNDRECHFRLGENGRIYTTFVRRSEAGQKVMFGIYKTWSGGWTALDPVVTLAEGHGARQPNIYPIVDDAGLAQILLGFIHIFPEGEGQQPPDGDGLWETIDQYIRVFSSGDTSPWFHVQ